MSFLKLLSRMEQIMANNDKYGYSCLTLIGLVGLWLNLGIHSLTIGFITFLLYLIPNTIFAGRAFFGKESLEFRLFYGFALLLALISISGSLTYLIYNFSDPMIMITLGILTVILTLLNGRRTSSRKNENLDAPMKPQERGGKRTSNWRVLDLLYLSSMFLCFYFLYSARTGESLRTVLDVVPIPFFISFFLATVSLLFMIFSKRRKTSRLLLYTILLISIPTSVYLLVFGKPVEPVTWWGIVWSRHFAQYGCFVSDPSHIEVATSPMHKQIAYLGSHVITVVLSKFLQLDPMWTSLIIPIFYFTYLPVTCYIQVKQCAKLKSEELGLVAVVLLLFSQHNIFLVTPPIKGETLALVFLFLAITFWVKYIGSKKLFSMSFFVATMFTITAFLIHQWAGQLALIAAVVSIYLNKFAPFRYGFRHCIESKGNLLGFLVLSALLSVSLIGIYFCTSILSPKSFSFSLNPNIDIYQLTSIVFPPLWFNGSLPVREQIFHGYLNNFSYVLYILIGVGFITAIKRKANLNWIVLILVLIVVSFANMIIDSGLFIIPGWGGNNYRYFYYLNHISSVLVGVGIYRAKEFIASIKFSFKLHLHGFRSEHVLSPFLFLFILILSGAVTASVYGGFPREDSMGPYNARQLRYVSEYDFATAKFIKDTEGDWNNDFYVFGDLFTSSALLSEFGAKTFVTPYGNYLFVSERPFYDEPWTLFTMITQPWRYPDVFYPLERIMNLTGAETVYLILTYRLGPPDHLQSLVDWYLVFLGKPVFSVEGKIYVFKCTSTQLSEIEHGTA